MAFPPWRHLSQMLPLGLKSFYLWLVSCFSFPPLLDPGVDKTCQDEKAGKVSLGVRRAAEGALQKPSIHESGDWAPTVCMTLGCPVGGTKEGGRPWRQFQGAQGGLKSTDTHQALFRLSIFITSLDLLSNLWGYPHFTDVETEVKWLTWDHTASKCLRQDSHPCSLDSEAVLLTSVPQHLWLGSGDDRFP